MFLHPHFAPFYIFFQPIPQPPSTKRVVARVYSFSPKKGLFTFIYHLFHNTVFTPHASTPTNCTHQLHKLPPLILPFPPFSLFSFNNNNIKKYIHYITTKNFFPNIYKPSTSKLYVKTPHTHNQHYVLTKHKKSCIFNTSINKLNVFYAKNTSRISLLRPPLHNSPHPPICP